MNLIQLLITFLIFIIILPKNVQQIKKTQDAIISRMTSKDQKTCAEFKKRKTYLKKYIVLFIIITFISMMVAMFFSLLIFKIIYVLIAIIVPVLIFFFAYYNKAFSLLLKYAQSNEKKELRILQIRTMLLFIMMSIVALINIILI